MFKQPTHLKKTTAIVPESKGEHPDFKKIRAQKILHRFFHYYCREKRLKPLTKPLWMLINDIKFAKHTDLQSGHHDKWVFDCIEYCLIFNNRASMHTLAYALFSGPRQPSFNYYYYLLIVLLHDPDASIKDIATVLKDAFVEWKNKKKFFVELKQTERKPDQYWGKNFTPPILPDEEVEISHGGGFYHLVDFFRGHTPGYKLECGGLGIQVSPRSKERSLSYSNHGKSIFNCDLPATLDAKISAKHLDLANNGYEAGLRTDQRHYLRDIDIKIHLPLWVGNISDEMINKCYPDDPILQRRLKQSLKNVEKVYAKAIKAAPSYWGNVEA